MQKFFKEMKEPFIEMKEAYKEIQEFLENWIIITSSDKNKTHLYLKLLSKMKENEFNKFIDNNIFPPIFYICDTFGNVKTKDFKNFTLPENINELIESKEVREYYIKNMNAWIEKETEKEFKIFIKEIQKNFKEDNIYTTTLTLFILIEHRVSSLSNSNDKCLKSQEIKNYLREYFFEHDYLTNNMLKKVYDIFIPNYYVSTNKAEKITRHMLHGKRFELINKTDMLSLIFFVDTIYKLV